MLISQGISRSQSLWNRQRLASLAAALVGLFAANAAVAQEADDVHPILTSKYSINVGVFFPERSFEIGVDGSVPTSNVPGGGGVETDDRRDIDVSEQFKLSSSETTQAYEIGWRFGKKWSLRGQYFKVGGSRSAVLEEDVVWGDYTFGAGTGVAGGIDVSITRVFVGRRFSNRDNYEWGIGAGVHRLDLSAYIAGQAIINNEPPVFTERRASTHGPLPNLGAWYVYTFNERWALTTRIDWLSASIDKYSGTIINASAGINFALNKHFLLGASYNYFEIDIDIKDDPWRGYAESVIDGAFGYISFHW